MRWLTAVDARDMRGRLEDRVEPVAARSDRRHRPVDREVARSLRPKLRRPARNRFADRRDVRQRRIADLDQLGRIARSCLLLRNDQHDRLADMHDARPGKRGPRRQHQRATVAPGKRGVPRNARDARGLNFGSRQHAQHAFRRSRALDINLCQVRVRNG